MAMPVEKAPMSLGVAVAGTVLDQRFPARKAPSMCPHRCRWQ